MKILYKIASYLSCTTLGIYLYSTINLNKPVELYRWILTSVFFIFFTILSNEREK